MIRIEVEPEVRSWGFAQLEILWPEEREWEWGGGSCTVGST